MEKHAEEKDTLQEEQALREEQALQEVLENIDHADFGEAGTNRSDSSTLKAAYPVDEDPQDGDYFKGEERQQEHRRPRDSSEDTVQNSKAVMFEKERAQQRSPPLGIAKIVYYPEKTAELFPSDSDLSSFGMMAPSRSSGSAFSLSRPSSYSRPSSLSMPSSMRSESGSEHGIWMPDVQPPTRNWNSVVLSSLEQTKENSARIDSIQKGTSKRAVRTKNQISKLQDRMDSVEDSQQKTKDELRSRVEMLEQQISIKVSRWMDREAEYSTMEAKAAQPATPAYPLPQSITMTWVVPYADLFHRSVRSIVSSTLQLPQAQGLQATLYLKGIGKGRGSHLSIRFRWVKTGQKQEAAERYPVNITVQILNQADASETIEKRLVLVTHIEDGNSSFRNDNLNNAIPKLIPISTVEDISLGYLTDGRLLINITAEEVLHTCVSNMRLGV